MTKRLNINRHSSDLTRLTGDTDWLAKFQSPQRRGAVTPSAAVARLKPYETVSQDPLFLENHTGACKLDWNESTQPPAPEIVEAVITELQRGVGNWYPDVNSFKLIKALADYTGLDKQYIQTFPGSDAALEYVCRTFLDSERMRFTVQEGATDILQRRTDL